LIAPVRVAGGEHVPAVEIGEDPGSRGQAGRRPLGIWRQHEPAGGKPAAADRFAVRPDTTGGRVRVRRPGRYGGGCRPRRRRRDAVRSGFGVCGSGHSENGRGRNEALPAHPPDARTPPRSSRRASRSPTRTAQLHRRPRACPGPAMSGVDRLGRPPEHPEREVQRSGDDARPSRYGSAQCDYRVLAISAISGCARSGQRGPDKRER
jgi:hypothetical protein